MEKELISVRDLTFNYPETEKPAVNSVSLTVNDGDFFVLCGRSGCGKTTLLRLLKPQIAPHGIKSGEIFFEDAPLDKIDGRKSTAEIGFVLQSPDNQIVTDKVWHELAFGLESLGYDTPVIRRRVAEMASFFGIQDWFYKNVAELSGGQKQLLNLASVMVMEPRVLILDEPTSQLDPIAASEFLGVLKKINREIGTTVILSEHRLEDALPLATRAAVMDKGSLACVGSADDIGKYLRENDSSMFLSMPTAMQVWGSVMTELKCPVSVNEGREFLSEFTADHEILPVCNSRMSKADAEETVSVNGAWFRYDRDAPDVLRGARLCAHAGELLCILGGNGTGKTTTLKIISGICKPYRGEVRTKGRVRLMPQDPQTLFVKKTVYEELCDAVGKKPSSEDMERIMGVAKLCRLEAFLQRHPYDLSGGEQQRAALAKLLLCDPDILLLDEPTKGLDAEFKEVLAGILKDLLRRGICIVMVSHDVEFCAKYADRCALFFDGSVVAEACPEEFFSGSFYTTSASRMARGIIDGAVTADDIICAIGGTPVRLGSAECDAADMTELKIKDDQTLSENKPEKLPLWRKIGAAMSFAAAMLIFFYCAKSEKLSEMIDKGTLTVLGKNQLLIYGVFIVLLVLGAVFVGRRSRPPVNVQTPWEKRRLSRRTRAAVALILLVVPLTLFIGVVYIDKKQYYITALAVLLECMLPFFMVFEGRRPKARELVVIAVLCSLSIAGRAAFFMLPQFKPVLAVTIIAGVAFGGETGFLVGALTMLISNIMFSQGPWTQWQMFAAGIVGFIAGVLYRKGWLRRTRESLSIFGGICAIVIYGGIMNPASALMWGGEALNFKIIAAYYVTGFPMDCVFAASTAIFLWFIAEPMLEKLDRIKVKYGLVE